MKIWFLDALVVQSHLKVKQICTMHRLKPVQVFRITGFPHCQLTREFERKRRFGQKVPRMHQNSEKLNHPQKQTFENCADGHSDTSGQLQAPSKRNDMPTRSICSCQLWVRDPRDRKNVMLESLTKPPVGFLVRWRTQARDQRADRAS